MVDSISAESDLGRAYELAGEPCSKFIATYWRALAELCELAEQVEEALGLPRFADPPPPKEKTPGGSRIIPQASAKR